MSKSTDQTKNSNTGIIVLRSIVGLFLLLFISLCLMYLVTPAEIRNPTNTHFHFRMDLVIEGKPVDFAQDKYQTGFKTDICSALLTKQPVHFHDRVNQFVHIHWAGITGGEVLKDYGWNMIGGLSNTLGWRFDKGSLLTPVGIHGAELPSLSKGSSEYVYVADGTSFKERTWESFLHQPLPVFFRAPLDKQARDLEPAISTDEQKLVQLNNVIGSVVIFVQKDRPTQAQISDRFSHLEPLPKTQCAG